MIMYSIQPRFLILQSVWNTLYYRVYSPCARGYDRVLASIVYCESQLDGNGAELKSLARVSSNALLPWICNVTKNLYVNIYDRADFFIIHVVTLYARLPYCENEERLATTILCMELGKNIPMGAGKKMLSQCWKRKDVLDVDVLSTVAAANAGNGNESDKPWPWFFIEPKRASDYISTDPKVKEANGSRRKKAMISCSSLFFFGGGGRRLSLISFFIHATWNIITDWYVIPKAIYYYWKRRTYPIYYVENTRPTFGHHLWLLKCFCQKQIFCWSL